MRDRGSCKSFVDLECIHKHCGPSLSATVWYFAVDEKRWSANSNRCSILNRDLITFDHSIWLLWDTRRFVLNAVVRLGFDLEIRGDSTWNSDELQIGTEYHKVGCSWQTARRISAVNNGVADPVKHDTTYHAKIDRSW